MHGAGQLPKALHSHGRASGRPTAHYYCSLVQVLHLIRHGEGFHNGEPGAIITCWEAFNTHLTLPVLVSLLVVFYDVHG